MIKLRHIGDVLLTVPTLRALRERFPSAHLSALVPKGMEEMLTDNPLLDEVITFDRGALALPLWKRVRYELRFVRELRRRRFDLVVDLTRGDRTALLGWLSGARVRIGWDPGGAGFLGRKYLYTGWAPIRPRDHAVEQNLNVVRQIGVDTADRSLAIFIPKEDRNEIDALFRRLGLSDAPLKVHLHPTSRWLFKCWPDEAMAALIDRLYERHQAKVILTCGPEKKEQEKAWKIVDLARFKPTQLIGKTTLKQLAAVSERCHLFIGVDTAPMHIAAAVGTPVVALFGPTGEFNWGPWGGGHTVVVKEMPCRPCGQAGCNNSKRSECLEILSIDEVWKAVDRKLSALLKTH